MTLILLQTGSWERTSELILVNVKTRELIMPDKNVSKIMNDTDFTNLMAGIFPAPGVEREIKYTIKGIL